MAKCLLVFYLVLVANVLVESNGTDKPYERNADEYGPHQGGDMILTSEQMGIMPKSGIKGTEYRWPKGQVPYVIDKSFTANERKVILKAISEIHNKTCIRLNPRKKESDYIIIVRGEPDSGCWSYVGRNGGNQTVNIQPGNPGCVYTGIVIHELIHAIGFFHEQSRSDRDKYVTINYQNIDADARFNFDKMSTGLVDSFGVPYDYSSIMHYSASAFSSNGKPTITAKKSGVNIGQRNRVSRRDALKINKMYNNCK